jgi:DNA-binding transcriptional LysR family regulator
MELHQVRYFLALCREQNFTRAARRCGVSQPSLSNALRRLEAELGGPLFHRGRMNCVLSELGEAMLPHLAKLDQCVRDARTQAAHFLRRSSGVGRDLRTGAIEQPASDPHRNGVRLGSP